MAVRVGIRDRLLWLVQRVRVVCLEDAGQLVVQDGAVSRVERAFLWTRLTVLASLQLLA